MKTKVVAIIVTVLGVLVLVFMTIAVIAWKIALCTYPQQLIDAVIGIAFLDTIVFFFGGIFCLRKYNDTHEKTFLYSSFALATLTTVMVHNFVAFAIAKFLLS